MRHGRFSEKFHLQWRAVKDNGYIDKNVCWLLRCASMRNEIMWQVCQPKRVIKQLKRYSESQSKDDLGNVRECVKTFTGRRPEIGRELAIPVTKCDASEQQGDIVIDVDWNVVVSIVRPGTAVQRVRRASLRVLRRN